MHKLLRIYNQNRGLVIAIVCTIALIIVIIQILNNLVAQDREARIQNILSVTPVPTDNKTIYQNSTSVLTGEKVQNIGQDTEVIKEFVKYCNDGEIEKAYNMLTADCKTRIYPSLEYFKKVYFDRIFTDKRMYQLENWYSTRNFTTYYIRYTEDVLSSGNISAESNQGDYITVVNQGDRKELNISSYVGASNINRSSTVDGVTVTVSKIHYYMDYTVLTLKVRNNTQNAICIDTKEKTGTMYLYDTNGVKYTAALNEKSVEEFTIRRNMGVNIDIKFNKIYNPESRDLDGLKLKDIVLNYENYISNNEVKKKIEIDVGI